ncbi:MAG: hypothetical protein ACLRQF_11015 [Thomasclavelia ramosa]
MGNYAGQAYDGSFNQVCQTGNDATYFLKNVKNVFENDDLTINLEGPLTSATSHVENSFLLADQRICYYFSGSVELVSIANNHSIIMNKG